MSGDYRSPGPAEFAEILYRANAGTWDIGECQPVIRQLVAHGVVRGRVLDAGCGTGWHAIEFARAGCTVTGIDAAPTAIERARRNARNERIDVDFRLGGIITTLVDYEGQFDCVIDAKLWDNLESTDVRRSYARALHLAMRPRATLVLFVFGPGSVNGVHNHLLEEPDYRTLLPEEGFQIAYTVSAVYELEVSGFRPLCASCPPSIPDGRMHIPVTEVHAIRLAPGGSRAR